MRLRTTAGAVLIVAVVLVVGAIALVALVRGSLRDGLETGAEQRASSLADDIENAGLPDPPERDDDLDEDDDEPEEVVWQVLGPDGAVVRSSQPLAEALPTDADEVSLAGGEHPYLLVTEDAERGDEDYLVVVAVSLEDVADSTAALMTPLLVGLPLVLLLVGGTTWLVAARSLAPVDRIRREVDRITGDRLDRRVPEPASRDEVHLLARTMNRMLGRLEDARDRQRQFVADASHELRSPLASIRQTAEVASAHPDALPPGELAEAVLEESARMQRIVEQLLLLTRTDEGGTERARRDVDLDDLVLAEGTRLRRTGLTVDTSAVGAGRVRGDELALAQVVRNLVDNAARHARTTVGLAVRTGADGVELVVDDDGPGIPAGDRERVFERFVRLDEARASDAGGSGLGLAIVKELVATHGGSVAVTDAPLGGARFAVRLPSQPGDRP